MAHIPVKPRTNKPYSGMANPFYNSPAWRRLSRAYRQEHPLCELCSKRGVIRTADMVDHIVPIRLGGESMDWNNCQSLCHKCHNRKSGREGHETMEQTNFETR